MGSTVSPDGSAKVTRPEFMGYVPFSACRTARHASHCKAKSALIKVQTGQVHFPSADDPGFGVFHDDEPDVP